MRRGLARIAAFGAVVFAPLTFAAECAAPPVTSSQQALCYASAYAEKNGLSRWLSLSKKVRKGNTVWTVRFVDTRPGVRGRGGEVDVEVASGRVVRFMSYK